MSDKSFIITSTLAAGTNDLTESPPMAAGKAWVIKYFGGCDINLGDNKSTVYILKFGSEVLKILSLTGETQTIKMGQEIIGDGAKKLSVTRYNNSGSDKWCPVWISAYER